MRRRPTLHALRKELGVVTVERMLRDGSPGMSKPCLGCMLALAALDIKVRYYDGDKWCVERSRDIETSLITLSDRRKWGGDALMQKRGFSYA
jgi:hypothetical protein